MSLPDMCSCLRDVVLQSTNNAIFQQDKSRPHTAYISQAFLLNVDILPWPACSPDLFSIKHVWDMMSRKIWQYQPPSNIQQLR
ncbi:EPC2 [Cordylochernes scorpioides]|uniref:EPC2 n=1 Tax=Cordylochernes scorpioides TaxID=51811 RepID=A0ABY6JZX5_9ARAC|nr:EPC2 [Cordylochernes scorpioides]